MQLPEKKEDEIDREQQRILILTENYFLASQEKGIT